MDNERKLVARLEQLESAVVADVMATMDLTAQVAACDIRPLTPRWKLAGPAICARGSDDPATESQPTFGLDNSIYPGGVVVIDTDNCLRGAIIGDNMVTSMMNRGAAGFIVDGGIRDYRNFLKMNIPVFCRYTTPVSAHKYWHFTQFETPITLRGIWGDITVNPGDLIIADADGTAVIPKEHATQIIADAEIHQQTENNIKNVLLAGGDREEVTGASRRLQHVKPLASTT